MFKKALLEKGIDEQKMIYIPNGADFTLSDELLVNFNSEQFKSQLGFQNNFDILSKFF